MVAVIFRQILLLTLLMLLAIGSTPSASAMYLTGQMVADVECRLNDDGSTTCIIEVCEPGFHGNEEPWAGTWGPFPETIGIFVGGVGPVGRGSGIADSGIGTGNWYVGYGC